MASVSAEGENPHVALNAGERWPPKNFRVRGVLPVAAENVRTGIVARERRAPKEARLYVLRRVRVAVLYAASVSRALATIARAARERRNPSGRFPPRQGAPPVPGNFSVATSPRRSGRREGFPPPPKRTPCKALKSSHARPFLVPMTQAAARRADRQIGTACLVPLPDCLASKEARRGFISYRVAGRTFERDAAGTRVGWRSNGGGPYIQRKVFR